MYIEILAVAFEFFPEEDTYTHRLVQAFKLINVPANFKLLNTN